MDKFGDLITDWGGFEQLITDMHNTGSVNVNRNIVMTGLSGAPRQIDVLITHQEGPYEYKTLAECKYWNTRVGRDEVDKFYSTMQDVNASKGVIFTNVGYQEGAEIFAKAKGIKLFRVRDLTDKEWGLPGRRILIYLQYFSKTVRNFSIVMAPSRHIPIHLGNADDKSRTEIYKQSGESLGSLEGKIEQAVHRAIEEIKNKRWLLNHGENSTNYSIVPVTMPFDPPIVVRQGTNQSLVFRINMEVGIKIEQSKIEHDRGQNFHYVLAVEDVVSRQAHLASKRLYSELSQWQQVNKEDIALEDVFVNGSIMQIVQKDFFDPKELDGKESISV